MNRTKAWRRLRMGLQTLFAPALGWRPRGFFIPYRYADTVTATQPAYAVLEACFLEARPKFRGVLDQIDGYAADLLRIVAEAAPPPAPRFDQSWFPTLDAAAAYSIVRRHRPRRIVEVGSGHSTRFLCRAAADAGLDTEITAIDPQPRAVLQGLPVRFMPAVVQSADPALFSALEAGDILFVDSSHILMPGTDVDWLFNRVLPALPAGVVLHIHDIFLPDDYPPDWQWRGYNEQQLLGPMLAGGFELLFASHYVMTRMGEEIGRTVIGKLPSATESLPASIWLIKRT